MRPIYHIISSFVLSVLFLYFTKSIWAGIACLLTGVFIDLDHLIDFWVLKPKNPFSIRDFLDTEKFDKQRKYIFVFLHSYELLAIGFILAYQANWPVVFTAIISAVALHLLLDTHNLFRNKENLSKFDYFLVYRIFRGFKKKQNI